MTRDMGFSCIKIQNHENRRKRKNTALPGLRIYPNRYPNNFLSIGTPPRPQNPTKESNIRLRMLTLWMTEGSPKKTTKHMQSWTRGLQRQHAILYQCSNWCKSWEGNETKKDAGSHSSPDSTSGLGISSSEIEISQNG